MAKTPTESLTLNPIAPGEVLTSTFQIPFSGTDVGVTGQIAIAINDYADNSIGVNGAASVGTGSNGEPVGLWGNTIFGVTGLPDGVYSATATATPSVHASENFILDQGPHSPFVVVGFTFLQVNDRLGSNTQALAATLQGEKAGLNILAADDYAPKAIGKLVADVTKELRILDFTGTAAAIPAATVTKLEALQTSMAAYVHSTPALLSLLSPNQNNTPTW